MDRKKSLGRQLVDVGNSLGAWLIVLLFIIILSVSTTTFLTVDNIINVVRQISVNAILALGVSFVVLGGEIDLSTGVAATFAGCNAALMMTSLGLSMYVAIPLCLAVGIVAGVITGLIVTYLEIPAFIASLGMQYILLGVTSILTNNMPISGLPQNYLIFGRGYIAGVIPVPAVIMAVYVAVGAVVLRYLPFGRKVIAVGENQTAARLSGINVNRIKIAIFAICGFCAASAGLVQASRMSSGQPGSGGDMSLQALAAVYVGGTFKGSMLNTLAGALALGLVNNGLNLLGVNPFYQKVALGVIIILAVLFDQYRIKKTTARK